jgi:YidC/Oxa1 family membrane protein insertase
MVLYVGTMVSTSVMMSVGSDRNQRLISIALPVVFVVFVIQFPAGLLVYWIATNFTMIPQQYFMLRRYGRPNVPVKVESNGRGSPGVAREAIKKPSAPPPSARPRKKRSGRRR